MSDGAGRGVIVRDAVPADLPVIQSIYAHHVLHGLASFEEVPPDEMQKRMEQFSKGQKQAEPA